MGGGGEERKNTYHGCKRQWSWVLNTPWLFLNTLYRENVSHSNNQTNWTLLWFLCCFILHAEQPNYPQNCLDALNRGYNVSGVYRILPDTGKPFDVYCDQVTGGGGWTVCQRRQDGSINFQHNRVEYIWGFGDLAGEHWLGLEKIHRLTKWVDFEPELRVDLMDFTN